MTTVWQSAEEEAPRSELVTRLFSRDCRTALGFDLLGAEAGVTSAWGRKLALPSVTVSSSLGVTEVRLLLLGGTVTLVLGQRFPALVQDLAGDRVLDDLVIEVVFPVYDPA